MSVKNFKYPEAEALILLQSSGGKITAPSCNDFPLFIQKLLFTPP